MSKRSRARRFRRQKRANTLLHLNIVAPFYFRPMQRFYHGILKREQAIRSAYEGRRADRRAGWRDEEIYF